MRQHGLTFEEHTVGQKFATLGRTVSETDIVPFVNLCGFNEPLFMDMEYVARESVFKGRPAPGALTFALSEGLIIQTGLLHGTGMAYLGGGIRIVAPGLAGAPFYITPFRGVVAAPAERLVSQDAPRRAAASRPAAD